MPKAALKYGEICWNESSILVCVKEQNKTEYVQWALPWHVILFWVLMFTLFLSPQKASCFLEMWFYKVILSSVWIKVLSVKWRRPVQHSKRGKKNCYTCRKLVILGKNKILALLAIGVWKCEKSIDSRNSNLNFWVFLNYLGRG